MHRIEPECLCRLKRAGQITAYNISTTFRYFTRLWRRWVSGIDSSGCIPANPSVKFCCRSHTRLVDPGFAVPHQNNFHFHTPARLFSNTRKISTYRLSRIFILLRQKPQNMNFYATVPHVKNQPGAEDQAETSPVLESLPCR